jgi:peptidyl-prolyl cis-trans isomerase C
VKLLAATAVILALASPVQAADPAADTVVAKVNGTTITLGHLVALYERLPTVYLSLPDEVLFGGLLDQLIQQTALAQLAEAKLTKRDELIIDVDRRAYLAGVIIDETALSAVTDESLAAAYELRFVAVEPQREYNAAHILVSSNEEAVQIRADIEAGADFHETARLKSRDGAAPDGGNLGWFELDMMVEPFAEAVAMLEPGKIGGPVETEYGWHLIKVLESRLIKAPAIEDVRAELENDIRAAAVEDRLNNIMNNLEVVKSIEGIDPAILRSTSILGN